MAMPSLKKDFYQFETMCYYALLLGIAIFLFGLAAFFVYNYPTVSIAMIVFPTIMMIIDIIIGEDKA